MGPFRLSLRVLTLKPQTKLTTNAPVKRLAVVASLDLGSHRDREVHVLPQEFEVEVFLRSGHKLVAQLGPAVVEVLISGLIIFSERAVYFQCLY